MTISDAPHLLSAFRQMHAVGRRRLVERIKGLAERRGGAVAARLCERMLEADTYELEAFAQIVVAYAELDPDLALGRSRRGQVRGFTKAGADARRVYGPDDRERWRRLHAEELAHHSQRRAATLIVDRERLPAKAFETVRRALQKRKRANPSD
jgi:hypothetical protein